MAPAISVKHSEHQSLQTQPLATIRDLKFTGKQVSELCDSNVRYLMRYGDLKAIITRKEKK